MPNFQISQISKYAKFPNSPNFKISQISKYPKFQNIPNLQLSQISKYPKLQNMPISKYPKFQNIPNFKIYQISKYNKQNSKQLSIVGLEKAAKHAKVDNFVFFIQKVRRRSNFYEYTFSYKSENRENLVKKVKSHFFQFSSSA